jgi:hypothetical protein
MAHLRSHGRRPRRLLIEGTPAAGVTRPIIGSATIYRMSAIGNVGVWSPSKFFRGRRKGWQQLMTRSRHRWTACGCRRSAPLFNIRWAERS